MIDLRSVVRGHIVLITLLGLVLGGLYFLSIDLRAPDASFEVHQRIIGGTAGSPYRYRVLVPLVLEALTRLFSAFQARPAAFLYASATYDCMALVGQVLALYALLRLFFPPRQALVGVAFTGGVTVATFSYFTYQPWSIMEVTFFSLGFLFAYKRRHWLAGAMVVLASLNRETGIFLPLALLLATVEPWRPLHIATWRIAAARPEPRLALGYVVLSASIFGVLRLLRGSADPVDPLDQVITRNLLQDNLVAAAIVLVLFLGLAWIYAVLGLASGPRFIGRVARVVPLYLGAFALWGWWREVRILTTLYPIVIPLVLAFCYGTESGQSDEVGSRGLEPLASAMSRRRSNQLS